ncbi:hypothetical protein Maq22A_1p35645 (plasmid) [Methylobacterium aquaticum]|jgi:hypothetical protein|uniref:Uncharacterized protein n=1 Tax=Methylobacterium aquaticum TaxID=270351 RepID=A0A0C6FLV7_9HYPH|nr:hypothetical protein Maq22A_1p35645 [Methylobacterium aquaticum]
MVTRAVIMTREVVVEATGMGEVLAIVIGINAAEKDWAVMYPDCPACRCEAGGRTDVGCSTVGWP